MPIDTAAMFLEREHELAALGRVLAVAREGRGRVVLVEGDAGIGKTSLLQGMSEAAAHEGFRCLRARASELEREFAYGCVRQLLEPYVLRAPDAECESLFAGAAALSMPLFALPDPNASVRAHTPFSMLHGLYWLLNNLAEDAPLVVIVDDLHWADSESLRFLNYLAPRLDGLALVVAASVRTRDSGHVDVARLATTPETIVLRPGPLSVDGTATLCEARFGAPASRDFATACWKATGGNPFYLDLLLREAAIEKIAPDAAGARRVRRMGPAAVAHAVLLRLSEAPPGAGELVRAVAVLCDGASLAEAAGLAGLAEDEAARAADLLAAHRILTPGDRLEFVHPIVREAVWQDIGSLRRLEDHARAASLLAALGASEERIAAHIIEAEPAGDAARVDLLRRVATEALDRGAPATAVALLRRARAEPPPPESSADVLFDLARAELRVADPAAIDRLGSVVELSARPTGGGEVTRPELLTQSVRLLATALTWSGQSDEAVAALASAIDVVQPVNAQLALLLEADLAAHAQEASAEARDPAAKRLEQHAHLPGATPAERLVLASLAFERARASDTERGAVAHLERALAGGQLLDEQDLDVPPSIYILVVGLLATDAFDLTDDVLDHMLADARTAVSIPAIAFVLAHQGVASLRRGAVTRAEADARTALDLLVANGIPLGVDLSLAVLIDALVEAGELDDAQQALVEHGPSEQIPAGMPTNALLAARAHLRVAQGRAAAGLDDMIEFGRRDERWGGANPLSSRWRSRAALAAAAAGDGELARQLAQDDLERARRWGAASGIGIALRASALVGGAAPIDGLEAAVDVLAGTPDRLEHARALVDLGAALRRANRRRDARGALQQGLQLAERCGAHALAANARTELRAAGGRSSAPAGGGVQQLTASERRVAELAAEGSSNPEIAQVLFVTRKTVETHLAAVYRKLEIPGRGYLVRALAQQT